MRGCSIFKHLSVVLLQHLAEKIGMNFNTILLTVQIIISVALVTVILLQRRGSGLGSAFGGGGGGGYYQKRGAEKMLFYSSIVLGALFLGVSFSMLFFS